MDNILKLLLGVLSVAGLIAMVTPTNMTVAPPPPIAAADPAVAAPTLENGNGDLPPEDPELIENEAEDDPFSTGEPMIDGNPINQQGQQSPNINNSESPQPYAPSYDPASYGIPDMTAYAAPPVYNLPPVIDTNVQGMPAQ